MKNKLAAIAVILMASTSSVMALSADEAKAEVKKWSAYDVDSLQKQSEKLNGQDSYPFCIVNQDGKLTRTVFPDKSKLGENVSANSVVMMMSSAVAEKNPSKVTYTWDDKDKGAYIRSIKDMGGTADGFCGYSYLVSTPVAPAANASSSSSSTPAASATPNASGAATPAANASTPAPAPASTSSTSAAAK